MTEYEQIVWSEIEKWRIQLLKPTSLFGQMSKKVQTKLNNLMPEKVQQLITDSISNMVKVTLVGSNLTTKKDQSTGLTLYEKDQLFNEKFKTFQKAAVVEGAGTGAGGILLAMTDFPLLLSIKIKFLFEVASVYGYNTDKYEERMFILHVFQLAFSGEKKRKETYNIIRNWSENKEILREMDWKAFQLEYRDYLDLAKLLQMLPGFGAVVGAYANHNLLETLGETAIRAYQLRYFIDKGVILDE
ncbi:EcsC family protein [Amphibacillus sediminis]|uniref:EcsC family protein n=1 Tax=Amphibacillus sediminis TaxID=360185 RepID=UPI00082E9959|nr:EcsC family protein [Amphibacillus sediminis]